MVMPTARKNHVSLDATPYKYLTRHPYQSPYQSLEIAKFLPMLVILHVQ
jgi:hypothetical protein